MNDRQSSIELQALLNPANTLKWMFRLWWLSFWSFLVRSLILLGIAAAVAVGVYLMLRQEDSWRGPVAALMALAINGIVGLVVAFQAAIGATVIRAVENLGLGHTIFDYLFSSAAGQEPESPDEARQISQSMEGMTSDELRALANDRASSLLNNIGVGQRVPAPVRWISKRVFGIATWGVVGIVMKFASNQSVDGSQRLSLDFIRNQLGAQIDKRLADEARFSVNAHVFRWFGGTVFLTLFVAGIIAFFV